MNLGKKLNYLPANIYRDLYPWRTLQQFLDHFINTIAYKSEDLSLVALVKPWGVGTHTVTDLNQSKQNQDKLLSKITGSPRYCIQDILEPLTDHLGSKNPFSILKSIDRYQSGLVLVTNDMKNTHHKVLNAIKASRSNKKPPFCFRAITSGYPRVKYTFEKVSATQVEIDELGDHKELIIEHKPKQRCINFQAEIEVKSINKELSTCLLDINVSKLRWDFPRCYVTTKAAFVLGDVRYSRRVRQIMGRHVNILRTGHDDSEPLSEVVRELLGVGSNAHIPLMLDLYKIRLPSYGGDKDFEIESKHVPAHFRYTAERLGLDKADRQQ